MLKTFLANTASQLPGETPALDAQVLLANVLGQNRTWVLAHPEASLSPGQEKKLKAAIARLRAGTPLPYVLGHWEFFGLDFEVSPDVLIPRPETELLVETALGWVHRHPSGHGYPQASFDFMDIGTGSGCIPIALATHVPRARITATDISPAALAIARRNAARHGVEQRIEFIECDLLPPPAENGRWLQLDLITANLPYIPTEILKDLPMYQHEPTVALDGGANGLALIGRLLSRLENNLEAGCLILLEIEASQGRSARALAEAAFPAAEVEIKKDLAGLDRLVVIGT